MPEIKSTIQEEPASAFTSMIDIVFLLLIFFILQPFKTPERQLLAEMPKDVTASNRPVIDPPVHIQLHVQTDPANPEDGLYLVNGKPVRFERHPAHPRGGVYVVDGARVDNGVAACLRQAAWGDEDVRVAIMPQLNVPFAHVLTALDQCYEARLTDVAFEGPKLESYVPGQDGRLR